MHQDPGRYPSVSGVEARAQVRAHGQLGPGAIGPPGNWAPGAIGPLCVTDLRSGYPMTMWHWFLTVTGSNDTAGTWYGFWSGFGSDLGEFAIVGGLISLYRQRICHARHCWRRGRYTVEGTRFTTCRKHDPSAHGEDEDPTAEDIAEIYHRSLRHPHRTRAVPRAEQA